MDRENKKIIQSFFDNFKMSGGGSIGRKKRVGNDITEQQNLIYGKLGSEIDLPENPLLLKQIGAILSGHAVEGNIELPDRIKNFGAKDFDYNTSRLNPTRFIAVGGDDRFKYDVSADKEGGRIGFAIPLGALSNLGRMFK
tara:strand:+ start:32 stop:451 length:420 start_codon:yes stop_codon:yes gene_type:complete